MRLVKILTSERKLFSGAFLDQVTTCEPLSPKAHENYGLISNPDNNGYTYLWQAYFVRPVWVQ